MKRIEKLGFDGKEVVVSRQNIAEILFQKGIMLFLDGAKIAEGKITGMFTVTEKNCEGHEPQPNMPVMPGVEFIEMAFQLLGVLLAKSPAIATDSLLRRASKGRIFIARGANGVKFNGYAKPYDTIVMDIQFKDVSISGNSRNLKTEGSNIGAKVNGKTVCTIGSVVIVGIDASDKS